MLPLALLLACRYEPIVPPEALDAATGDSRPDTAPGPETSPPAGDAADTGPMAEPEPDAGPAPDTAPTCGNTCSGEMMDGCCPAGCTAVADLDCAPRCGNGALEMGERCDPPGSCPTACPNRGCTRYRLEGDPAACTAACVETSQETACLPDDGCCPAGCTGNNDSDCLVVCGNAVKERNETCDPLASCPTACPAQGCQLRKLANAGTCTAQCVNDGQQSACRSGDGCCPSGCNSTNDQDCPVVCNNGIKERGETCDPVATCMQQQAACKSDQNTVRTPGGSASACTFRCQSAPRACGPADGQCPSGCGRDPDCLPRPTNCVRIEWCAKPNAPNQGKVICITNVDGRCTDSERINECAQNARTVCGNGHARPIIYDPPIGGAGSG